MDVTISLPARAVFFTPAKKSRMGTVLLPFRFATLTLAFRTNKAGAESAAGEALQVLDRRMKPRAEVFPGDARPRRGRQRGDSQSRRAGRSQGDGETQPKLRRVPRRLQARHKIA